MYLRDVAAKIEDGPAEPSNYVLFGDAAGRRRTRSAGDDFPAVTITVAKRKGTNATMIAKAVLKRIDELRGNAAARRT